MKKEEEAYESLKAILLENGLVLRLPYCLESPSIWIVGNHNFFVDERGFRYLQILTFPHYIWIKYII